MRAPLWLVLAAAAVACTPDDPKPGTDSGSPSPPTTDPDDRDGDGHSPPQDCDDDDPAIHPGAEDAPYDGVDADCGGGSDNDVDRDGHDWDGTTFGDDCDDQNADVHPGMPEVCNGVDDDCDGMVDPAGAGGEVTWYTDADADGYGDDATALVACDPPPDAVDVGGDCDDAAPAAHPGAVPVACDGLDNDCDPTTFELGQVTLDGAPAGDLLAAFAAAGPGAVIELCEGRYPVDGVVLAEAVVLVGPGAAVTVVDAERTGPVLEVAGLDPVHLEGVTLTGGLGRLEDGERRGGGLYLHPGATVQGVGLVLTDNVAGAGGGAWLSDGATLDLQGGAITANHADPAYAIVSSGGGVQAGENTRIYLDQASIDHNDADMCGGASVGPGTLVDGYGTGSIADNATLGLAGGGICAHASTLRGLEIARNYSQNASGGIDGWDVTLEDLTVIDNTSDLTGGGGTMFGVCSILGCTFTGNTAFDGGALFVDPGTTTVTSSVITDNHIGFFASLGGGVAVFEATFASVATDWGTGKLDNTPADVSLIGGDAYYLWDGVADFVCVDDGELGSSCE